MQPLQCPPSLHLCCRSWKHTESNLYCFLGFYHTYWQKGNGNGMPDLRLIRDDFHPGFTSFISFLKEKQVEGEYMAKMCLTGKQSRHARQAD